MVFIGPLFPVTARSLHWRALRSSRQRAAGRARPPLTTRGFGKFNPHYWRHGGYADFVDWWASEDAARAALDQADRGLVAWAHDTDGTDARR